MIIHSYATDGYHKFAKTLLLSFKEQHGEEIPFIMHTNDMTQFHLDQLHSIYKNLTIKNRETDWNWLEKASGVPVSSLKHGKSQVELLGNRYLSKQFYHWKHYISICCRYRDALKEILENAEEGEHILHLDVDLYINNKIDVVFNTIKTADVSILLRPENAPEWRKVYGCILGFTVNEKSKRFMKRVRQHIAIPKFKDIEKGYGQIVFWRAWNELKDSDIRFAKIPKTWIHKGFNDRALILSANNGLKKEETAEKYRRLARNEPIQDTPPARRNKRKPKLSRVARKEGENTLVKKRPSPTKRKSVGTTRGVRPGRRLGRRPR